MNIEYALNAISLLDNEIPRTIKVHDLLNANIVLNGSSICIGEQETHYFSNKITPKIFLAETLLELQNKENREYDKNEEADLAALILEKNFEYTDNISFVEFYGDIALFDFG